MGMIDVCAITRGERAMAARVREKTQIPVLSVSVMGKMV
jgi:gamma-glutamyl phosphate reductase